MKTKKITMLAMLAAISVVIAILESFIPFIGNIIPGLKLGLANIIVIYTLYRYGFKDAIIISLIRVFVVALLRTGFGINFLFSLGGAIFSILSMALIRKTKLSMIGISIIGSVFHSIGQVLVGILIIDNYNIIYYLPYLLIFSIPTGLIVGIMARKIFDYTKNIY